MEAARHGHADCARALLSEAGMADSDDDMATEIALESPDLSLEMLRLLLAADRPPPQPPALPAPLLLALSSFRGDEDQTAAVLQVVALHFGITSAVAEAQVAAFDG
eukprot:gnl/Ergobibamus_cyprinoides/865.p2 GENE.gnl/Ergobibamus_cyprinoides/865~~gnl/Ergobibamus_cyprinoides/865.p2  ORF type:complete len:106 (+),score=21.62 gnl/Ergobibamus_cyprinoides/865:462-779(+)